jgi:hypothetical protein
VIHRKMVIDGPLTLDINFAQFVLNRGPDALKVTEKLVFPFDWCKSFHVVYRLNWILKVIRHEIWTQSYAFLLVVPLFKSVYIVEPPSACLMLSMNALNQITLPTILAQSVHFAIGIKTNSPSLWFFWGELIVEEDISGAGIKIHKCFIFQSRDNLWLALYRYKSSKAVSSVFDQLHLIEVVSWPAQKIMDLRKYQSPPQSFENRLKCFSEMVFSDKHNLFQFQFLELGYCDYNQNVCSVFSFWLCQKVPSFHCVFGVLWDYSYEMVLLVMFHLAVIERTHVLLVNYHNFFYILCHNFSFDLL